MDILIFQNNGYMMMYQWSNKFYIRQDWTVNSSSYVTDIVPLITIYNQSWTHSFHEKGWFKERVREPILWNTFTLIVTEPSFREKTNIIKH